MNATATRRRLTASTLLATLLAISPLAAEAGAPLRHGTWTRVAASAEGSWRIVADGESLVLELDAVFETKSAPDLKLYLSPRPVAELDADNVGAGALLIAPLESPKGAQRYTLPAGADLASYRSIAIHCEKYAKLWAKAAL